jgi:type VI secretion system secreted protein VgrG
MADTQNQFPGNRNDAVGINDQLSVGGDRRVSVRRNQHSEVAANQSISVGKTLRLDLGEALQAQVGKHICLEAADLIEFKVGAASLILRKDGSIELKGRDISLSSSGKVVVKESADTVIRGSKLRGN